MCEYEGEIKMKQTIKWTVTTLAVVLLLLCVSGGTANTVEQAGVVGDCFPDEPVLTPDMPEYHCVEGGRHYGQRQYDLALDSYRMALEIDSSYSNAYHGLAFTYRAMGRFDLAIENYSEVICLEPDYAQPYESRAELYQCVGLYNDAESDLDSYVRLYGQYPVPYLARGDFFMEQREYARASDDYAMAIERNPKLQVSYVKYTGALLLSGKTEEARIAFEQAAALGNSK